MKLDELNVKYPDNIGMRESIRLDVQSQLLRESREPKTGVYWWCPAKDSWRLSVFFDEEFDGAALHKEIWEKWCSTLLNKNDNKAPHDVSQAYHGLPRGRISKDKHGWMILHGDDTPLRDGLEYVANRFYLPKGKFRAVYDPHEIMHNEDIALVQQFIGRDLGLL